MRETEVAPAMTRKVPVFDELETLVVGGAGIASDA
jgi:hypothetical protein